MQFTHDEQNQKWSTSIFTRVRKVGADSDYALTGGASRIRR